MEKNTYQNIRILGIPDKNSKDFHMNVEISKKKITVFKIFEIWEFPILLVSF